VATNIEANAALAIKVRFMSSPPQISIVESNFPTGT
jgi:hypothetical protein